MKHIRILVNIVLFLFFSEYISAQCIARSSGPGTDAQTVCINTGIQTITYLAVPGVTNVTAANLPPGVIGSFSLATLTYTITGTPTVVGAYTYILSTTGGCIGIISGSITVTPDQVITLTSAPATTAQTVCASTPITNITYAVTGGGTGANVTGLPGGVTGTFNSGIFTISGTPSESSSGVYSYTVTTTGSCKPATATGTITVNPLPATTAANNGPVCVGSTLTLIGAPSGGGYSYAWTGPNSFSSTAMSPTVSTNATLAMAGTYTLTVTRTSTGCKSSASTDVAVNSNPVATAGSNSPLCVGATINLTGGPSGPYTYSWTGPNGFTSTAQNPSRASATTSMAGTYTLTVTNTNGGCQGTIGTTVVVNSLPLATASNNGPVCAGTALVLTGGPAGVQYSYSWTGPNGFSSNLMSPTVSSSATLAMAGTYTLTITNSSTGCQNIASTSVTVNALPVATAANNGPVCVGNPIILAGGPSGMTTYHWSGPNGYSNNTQNPVVSSAATASMAGIYTLTVTNSTGCLGTATTTVVVNPVPVATASNNGPICAGQPLILTGGPAGMLSYSWTGPNSYVSNLQSPTVSAAATTAMAGVYTLVVTNGTSCTSTITTTVVVNPAPVATASNSGPVCVGSALALTGGPAGMTSYSWTGPDSFTSTQMSPPVSAGATMANAGIYTLTVATANGCQDTATTRALVYTVPVANAGTGGTECDLNFVLNAVPSVGTGLWTMVTTTGTGTATFIPNANAPNATVTVTAYGSYTFRWTETNGPCTSSAVVTVNFYQQPVANAGAGGNECDLNFTFSAVPSVGIGTWTMTTGTGTAVFSNPNLPAASVTVSTYGTKVFTWTEVNGTCTNSANVTVNFNQQPVAEAGTGGNNCGNEYNLKAVPTVGTGTWTRISGPGNVTFLPNANTATARATITVYGVYVFRWTEVNGTCSSYENITVTYIQQPSADAGNGGSECDKNFVLNATAGTGTWSMVSGPGTATFSPNANTANATVTVTQFGAYEFAWTITNSLCTSSDIINVSFHDLPALDAGNDLAVCKGSGIQLNASGTGTFSWAPVNLLNNPGIFNPIATPVITTTFTVTLTDQYGCKRSDQVNVEVRTQPVAVAGTDQTLEYLFEAQLEAEAPGNNETGEWTLLSGSGDISDINDPEAAITDLELGENSLIWTVTNGVCPVASDTVYIVVNDLLIPTLITPNNDGKNDLFIIKGIETLGKTSLTVFNRWGNRVFENKVYDNKWNGVNDNENPLTDDTYFFVLKPEKSKAVTGYVVVRR